jgi:hypothetical protein
LAVDDNGNRLWFTDPQSDIDVAVLGINVQLLQEDGIQFNYFRSDEHSSDIDAMRDDGVAEGDFVYILGFPMGIVSPLKNVAIVRGGVIARVRDVLDRVSDYYLVDASIFPGNSGGPVVAKPEMTSITGTKSKKRASLVGIVKAYVPYRDVAISQQTGQTRVIFEENSGLALVHPIDYINNAIKAGIDAQSKGQVEEIPSDVTEDSNKESKP